MNAQLIDLLKNVVIGDRGVYDTIMVVADIAKTYGYAVVPSGITVDPNTNTITDVNVVCIAWDEDAVSSSEVLRLISSITKWDVFSVGCINNRVTKTYKIHGCRDINMSVTIINPK